MTLKIACIQLTSADDMAANIAKVERLVKKAAGQGAEFVALPENAFFMQDPAQKKRALYAQDVHPGVAASARLAKEYGIWLLAGSIAVVPNSSPIRGEARRGALNERSSDKSPHPNPPPTGEGKVNNRSLLFSPQGKIVASYDKIHLFDVTLPGGERYAESERFVGGNCLSMAKTKWGTLGLTICYDVRFPHLFRALAKKGAQIISVPSAFTKTTGEAHWHVLLRARAIENGCFIIAPAQTGTHPGGRKTFGHSLIVDPWGKILVDGGTKEGVVMAEIDLSQVAKVRGSLPSLMHDREFR